MIRIGTPHTASETKILLLGAGELVLLLRKGGLWERREGFEVEHRSFWIFPTLFHQNPDELQPRFSRALERAVAANRGPDEVRLEYFAEVTDALRLEDLTRLLALAPLQALTPETIQARFHYRNRPWLHALVVRVHRLPEPVIIPNTLDYEGCVSWVELDDAIDTATARPVLSDASFAAARAEVMGVAGV